MKSILYTLFGKEYGDHLMSIYAPGIFIVLSFLLVCGCVYFAVKRARKKEKEAERLAAIAGSKAAKEEKPEESKTEEAKPEEDKTEEVKPKETETEEEKNEETKTEEIKPEESKTKEEKAEKTEPEEEEKNDLDKAAQKTEDTDRKTEKKADTTPVDEKPGMIRNPMKIPPVNEKQELDYDVKVSENDDYDIK